MTGSTARSIWFWQGIVSPHMAGLAVELANQGCEVTYVAGKVMSAERSRHGWTPPPLPGVRLVLASSFKELGKLVASAPPDSIHICQGIRGNRMIGRAQAALAKRCLHQWVVMETVDDAGWKGFLKRLEYSRRFRARRNKLQGVLAIGHRTAEWVSARGMPAGNVFPFAYFLPGSNRSGTETTRSPRVFRFCFVGQLVPRKRVDWLISALSALRVGDGELLVVGTGPEEPRLRTLAEVQLPDLVRWLGTIPLPEVPTVLAQADCLVLPSSHDGWGAVVSEALMAGTPVVCSDACGAAGVVLASGVGGVFRRDRHDELAALLNKQIQSGAIDRVGRERLAAWATALGADAGARYLLAILDYASSGATRPALPWLWGFGTGARYTSFRPLSRFHQGSAKS